MKLSTPEEMDDVGEVPEPPGDEEERPDVPVVAVEWAVDPVPVTRAVEAQQRMIDESAGKERVKELERRVAELEHDKEDRLMMIQLLYNALVQDVTPEQVKEEFRQHDLLDS